MTNSNTSGDAATYADRVTRHVPGLSDMHHMAGLLLSERVPKDGRVLVLGAGGGLELDAFARLQKDWKFDGVDPSEDMLDQARDERLRTLKAIRQRLRRDAPFVVAHHSFPQDQPERDLWLRRNADLLISHGLNETKAKKGIEAMKTQLPVLSPEQDQALMRQAGFDDVQLFYAGFTFKGWVCSAA